MEDEQRKQGGGASGSQGSSGPDNPVISPSMMPLIDEAWAPPPPREERRPEREAKPPAQQPSKPEGAEKGTRGDRPAEQRRQRGPKREAGGAEASASGEGRREGRRDRGDRQGRDAGGKGRRDRGRDVRGPRGEGPVEIDLDKLMADPLYLDNQAHAVVVRMRDVDSGTKSQLRRLYGAVRRAVRTPEDDRQHQFVMLRARLAYTIARHSLRSLDGLEKLLLQVTRKNEARGYERFKDLFEAIVAYNE